MPNLKIAVIDNEDCIYGDIEKKMCIFINKKLNLFSCVVCGNVFGTQETITRHLRSNKHQNLVFADKNEEYTNNYLNALNSLNLVTLIL